MTDLQSNQSGSVLDPVKEQQQISTIDVLRPPGVVLEVAYLRETPTIYKITHGPYQAGAMFWFIRKIFSGSHLFLASTSLAQTFSVYASLTLSAPSSLRKFT